MNATKELTTAELINQLSGEDRNKFLSILQVQPKLYIERNGSEYTFTVGVALTATYEERKDNWKSFTIKNSDVYSEEFISAMNKTLPDMNW